MQFYNNSINHSNRDIMLIYCKCVVTKLQLHICAARGSVDLLLEAGLWYWTLTSHMVWGVQQIRLYRKVCTLKAIRPPCIHLAVPLACPLSWWFVPLSRHFYFLQRYSPLHEQQSPLAGEHRWWGRGVRCHWWLWSECWQTLEWRPLWQGPASGGTSGRMAAGNRNKQRYTLCLYSTCADFI